MYNEKIVDPPDQRRSQLRKMRDCFFGQWINMLKQTFKKGDELEMERLVERLTTTQCMEVQKGTQRIFKISVGLGKGRG